MEIKKLFYLNKAELIELAIIMGNDYTAEFVECTSSV